MQHVPTGGGEASRGAVRAVVRGAALAGGEAVDVGPVGGLPLPSAVHASAAGGGNALNLLHASVRLKLGLQHILQPFCSMAVCELLCKALKLAVQPTELTV